MSPLLSQPRTIALASAASLSVLIVLGWLALSAVWPDVPAEALAVETAGYAVPEAPERLPAPTTRRGDYAAGKAAEAERTQRLKELEKATKDVMDAVEEVKKDKKGHNDDAKH